MCTVVPFKLVFFLIFNLRQSTYIIYFFPIPGYFSYKWLQRGNRIAKVEGEWSSLVYSWSRVITILFVDQFEVVLPLGIRHNSRRKNRINHNLEKIVHHPRQHFLHKCTRCSQIWVSVALNQPKAEVFIEEEIKAE